MTACDGCRGWFAGPDGDLYCTCFASLRVRAQDEGHALDDMSEDEVRAAWMLMRNRS